KGELLQVDLADRWIRDGHLRGAENRVAFVETGGVGHKRDNLQISVVRGEVGDGENCGGRTGNASAVVDGDTVSGPTVGERLSPCGGNSEAGAASGGHVHSERCAHRAYGGGGAHG